MRHYQSFLNIIVLGVAASTASFACAQEVDAKADVNAGANADEPALGLGLGVGIQRSPYRGYGTKTRALPILLYNSKYFHVAGTTADFKLGSVSQFDFTLRAKYSNDGYKSGDAPILNGMDERKDGFWLGGAAAWRAPFAKFTLEWLKAAGNSDGQTVKLGVERGFSVGRVKLTPHLGVTWMNNDYVNYYYGVKSTEATSTRAAYTGKSTTNASAGLRADYSLTRSQLMFLDLSVTHYGSGITDSPLVDRSTTPSLRLGYLYKF
ncbi:outer membrane protein V [Herbaspirillum sp. CF444]|uniref:MipA/OmpV family protein n=1 Tax=Herbaspirillum sp. CF444 TaxID=1144319 RepID=UPI0002727EBD|nr:MipA/OmpV family protein [Herbaspirillum sp. CF444]EJL87521.1 outer membrane protein V [Herbaspirillum sp. CF444]